MKLSNSLQGRFPPAVQLWLGSAWSSINVAEVEVLLTAGRVLPAGLAAFAQCVDSRSGIYSFEQTTSEIDERDASQFWTERAVWKCFACRKPPRSAMP